MPLPQVAVEIVVPDAPSRGNAARKNPVESPELRRALLQACSDTVQVAVCVNADAARHASALALVFWKTGGRVRIEVGSKDAPGGQTWTSRDIEFSHRDAPLDRWRAAGYAAGTLASLVVRGDRAASSTAATPSPPPAGETTSRDAEPQTTPASEPQRDRPEPRDSTPAPPPAEPEKRPVEEKATTPERSDADEGEEKPIRVEARERRPWTWSFDAAGVLGSGIDENPRYGGLVRVTRAFNGPLVTASVGYALERTGLAGLSAQWISPTIGIGYVFPLGNPFTLEMRAEFIAERIEGVAKEATTGQQGAAWRWLLGGRAGAGIAWAPFESVGVLLGAAVAARGPETDLVVKSLTRGTTPILTYQLEGGLRFMLR